MATASAYTQDRTSVSPFRISRSSIDSARDSAATNAPKSQRAAQCAANTTASASDGLI